MTVQHEIKAARAQFKAVTDAPAGTFEAIVSVFGNVDLGGDRVMPGAFARTLSEWEASGDPIPVIWSHEWDDPMSHIGYVEKAEERPEGLYVRALLDVDNNERAAYVARLLKERRVREFSFGYFAKGSELVDDDEYGKVRELTEIDLFEVGPTLLGMNPDTVLLEAASRLAEKDLDAESKIAAPQWMRDNARQGLEWYEDGLAGDGVVERTVREARQMAAGQVSEDKATRMAAWFARHMVDLDAPGADPDSPDFPTPGVVAHALWGGGTRRESERAMAWAESQTAEEDSAAKNLTETIDEELVDVSRDTPPTIDHERLVSLLARPRYTEE